MIKPISFLLIFVMLLGVLCSCKNDADKDVGLPSDSTNITSEGTEAPSNEDEFFEDDFTKYNKALSLLQQGKLEEAYAIFLTIKDYKDVGDYLECFSFQYETKVNNGFRDIYYEYDEYGKVTYEYHFPTSISGYSYTYEYDEHQRLIKEQYDSDLGQHQNTKLYEYDTDGNLIKQTDVDEDTVYVTSVEFDERGNKTRVVSDKYNITIEYQYDGANNPLEMIIRNQDDEVIESYFYEYDSNHRLICQRSQYGSVTEVITYEYDESGNTVCVINENNGKYISRYDYEYDENGKCKKQLNTYSSGNGSVILWSYDENGNVIEERHEENGKCLSSIRYEYDENGNCIKETSAWPTMNRFSEEIYEYDKWGNLLRLETVEHIGEDSQSRAVEYLEYKLFYNPYLTQKLPLYAGK